MDTAPAAAAASPSMANPTYSSSVGCAAADPMTTAPVAASSANLASTVSTPSSSQESLSPPPSPLHEEEMETAHDGDDDTSQLTALIDEIYDELATYRPELLDLIVDEEVVDAIFDALNEFRPHFALVLASLPPEAFPIDPVLVARSGFEALVREVRRQWRS